jgi:alkylation response protein AidB-like acyl-CoA dehydrogenase
MTATLPAAPVDVARVLRSGFAERAAERLGGSGGGFADYIEVAMELAAGNGATALPGITVEGTWDSLGMRATASHDDAAPGDPDKQSEVPRW